MMDEPLDEELLELVKAMSDEDRARIEAVLHDGEIAKAFLEKVTSGATLH